MVALKRNENAPSNTRVQWIWRGVRSTLRSKGRLRKKGRRFTGAIRKNLEKKGKTPVVGATGNS
jgi:hypothetical protein